MLKKIASLAAMLSASLTVSSCETVAYKPIICDVGTALKDGRCQKVKAPKAKPRVHAPATRSPIVAHVPNKPRPSTPKLNEYGIAQ